MNAKGRDRDALVFAPSESRFEFDHNVRRFSASAKQFRIIYPRWNSIFEVQGKNPGSEKDILYEALQPTYERLWVAYIRSSRLLVARSY